MKRLMGQLVVGIFVVITADGVSAQDKAKSTETNQLAPLSRFIGEWTIEGKWSSGEELRARNVYESGLGNRIIKSKTFVKTDKGEYQRYDAVMAWHPKKKQLFSRGRAKQGPTDDSIQRQRSFHLASGDARRRRLAGAD